MKTAKHDLYKNYFYYSGLIYLNISEAVSFCDFSNNYNKQ